MFELTKEEIENQDKRRAARALNDHLQLGYLLERAEVYINDIAGNKEAGNFKAAAYHADLLARTAKHIKEMSDSLQWATE